MASMLASTSGGATYDIGMKYLDSYSKICQYVRYEIPPYGGVVFSSDMLHAGVENTKMHCTMRGFCQFQGDVSLGYKLVDTVSKLFHTSKQKVSKFIRSQETDAQENICLTVSSPLNLCSLLDIEHH